MLNSSINRGCTTVWNHPCLRVTNDSLVLLLSETYSQSSGTLAQLIGYSRDDRRLLPSDPAISSPGCQFIVWGCRCARGFCRMLLAPARYLRPRSRTKASGKSGRENFIQYIQSGWNESSARWTGARREESISGRNFWAGRWAAGSLVCRREVTALCISRRLITLLGKF